MAPRPPSSAHLLELAQATARLARSLAAARTVDDVVLATLHDALPAMRAQGGAVTLLDPSRSHLRTVGATGYAPEDLADWAVVDLALNLPITDTARDGQARILGRADLRRHYPHMPQDTTHPTGAVAALPLEAGGAVLGVLAVSFDDDHDFGDAEREYLSTVAVSCALALERARLHGRVEAELALKREVLESVDDAFFLLDHDGRLTYANGGAFRLWRREPGEVLGRHLAEAFPEATGSESWDRLGRALTERHVDRFETVSPVVGRWVEVSAHPMSGGLGVYVRDIEGRKHTEEELRRNHDRLALALQSAGIGLWDWDMQRDETIWLGEMRGLLGLPPGAPATFEAFESTVHPADRPALGDAFRASLEERRPYDQDFRVILPDGSVRWLHTVGQVVFDGDRAVRSIGVDFDITDRKRLDEALRSANADLELRVRERTARLEALNAELTAFAGALSQDLQEPAQRISGFAALLERRLGQALGERVSAPLAVIRAEAERVTELVADLRGLARFERRELQWQDVALGPLVSQVRSDLVPMLRGRSVLWEIAELPVVRGDLMLLRQALTNVVHNALKFTRTRDVARVEIGADVTRDEVRLWVRDNGVGFEQARAEELFRVFGRLHEDYEGAGVGLANVRRILARHGGRVWARGEPGVGATVYLSLPHAWTGSFCNCPVSPSRRADGRRVEPQAAHAGRAQSPLREQHLTGRAGLVEAESRAPAHARRGVLAAREVRRDAVLEVGSDERRLVTDPREFVAPGGHPDRAVGEELFEQQREVLAREVRVTGQRPGRGAAVLLEVGQDGPPRRDIDTGHARMMPASRHLRVSAEVE
ncbi:ATP-binding protein [Deinococcus pimensis]|uniref:ATP-binding protein n=1 Tax=Deinococcus pimensis TaxID=309888 RepID=UPI0004BCBE99|nr:ATP-binding protein [Deinococcus pimensis]